MDQLPIACDMNVFDSQERSRYDALCASLVKSIREVRELEDGYAFRLDKTPNAFRTAAEFMSMECRCCGFLHLSLGVEPGGEPWFRLTGREGVKAFLELELGSVVRPD